MQARALLFLLSAAFGPWEPAALPVIDDAAIAAERKRFETEANIKTPCAMPKPSDGAKVVVLSGRAEAMSSVTVGSQDLATRTAAIVVDRGREPLYLVIGSFPSTIWRISGAVERIERLVLAGGMTGFNRGVPGETPLIGATGVASERVTFLRHPHCLHLYEQSASWIETVDRLVQFETGRRNSRRGAFGEVSEVTVPSFKHRTVRREPMPMVIYNRSNQSLLITGDPVNKVMITGRNDLAEEFKLFVPAGMIEVDAGAVIGSLPAAAYDVLPQQAGLIQLVQSGALTRDDEGDFIIKRKIRLPAEMNGGHKFRVPRGVPAPDGHPGHACVFLEETGAPLKDSRC